MTDHIYKLLELTGTSETSIEDAVNRAIAKASQTVHNIRWFEMTEVRGGISESLVTQWQVTIRVGFTIDD